MDNDIIDVTDFFERPSYKKRSPRPKQTIMTHTTTQGHCPTPQSSPTYLSMNTTTAAPAEPTEPRSKESSQTKERYPLDGQLT